MVMGSGVYMRAPATIAFFIFAPQDGNFARLVTHHSPNGAIHFFHDHLTVAGTTLVAKGFVQASEIEPVIGALLTIGSVVWSVADKSGR